MADRTVRFKVIADADQAAREFGGLEGSVGKLEGRFGSLKTMAVPALAAVGAAAVGAATALFKIGSEIDGAYDKIRIKTGQTGEALKGLEKDFRAVAKGVPSSFGDVSEAVAGLNQRLGLTGKPLQDLSTQMLNLSRLTGTELGPNVEKLSRFFADAGVPAAEYGKTLDALWKASQTSGVSFDRLAEAAVKFGTPMRQLGFDTATTTAMLASFEKGGVNTELVMGSLRIALGKLAKGKVGDEGIADVGDRFRALVEDIKSIKDPMEATGEAIRIFGAKAGPDMAGAIREGKLSIDDLVKSISANKDTINQAAQDTEDGGEKWQRALNNVKLLLEPIASDMFGFVAKGAEWAEKGISAISTAYEQGGWGGVAEAIQGGVGGALDEFGDWLTGGEGWDNLIDTLTGWMKGWNDWFDDFSDKFTANLVGAAETGIRNLGAWFFSKEGGGETAVALGKFVVEVFRFLNVELPKAILKLTVEVAKALGSMLADVAKEIPRLLGSWTTAFVDWVKALPSALASGMADLVSKLGDAIFDAFKAAWDRGADAVNRNVPWLDPIPTFGESSAPRSSPSSGSRPSPSGLVGSVDKYTAQAPRVGVSSPAALAAAGIPAGYTGSSSTSMSSMVSAMSRAVAGLESGGNYTAQSRTSTASGKYQWLKGTWNNYGGYAEAHMAPPEVQERRFQQDMSALLKRYNGNFTLAAVAWFQGQGAADRLAKGDQSVLSLTDANGFRTSTYASRVGSNAQRFLTGTTGAATSRIVGLASTRSPSTGASSSVSPLPGPNLLQDWASKIESVFKNDIKAREAQAKKDAEQTGDAVSTAIGKIGGAVLPALKAGTDPLVYQLGDLEEIAKIMKDTFPDLYKTSTEATKDNVKNLKDLERSLESVGLKLPESMRQKLNESEMVLRLNDVRDALKAMGVDLPKEMFNANTPLKDQVNMLRDVMAKLGIDLPKDIWDANNPLKDAVNGLVDPLLGLATELGKTQGKFDELNQTVKDWATNLVTNTGTPGEIIEVGTDMNGRPTVTVKQPDGTAIIVSPNPNASSPNTPGSQFPDYNYANNPGTITTTGVGSAGGSGPTGNYFSLMGSAAFDYLANILGWSQANIDTHYAAFVAGGGTGVAPQNRTQASAVAGAMVSAGYTAPSVSSTGGYTVTIARPAVLPISRTSPTASTGTGTPSTYTPSSSTYTPSAGYSGGGGDTVVNGDQVQNINLGGVAVTIATNLELNSQTARRLAEQIQYELETLVRSRGAVTAEGAWRVVAR